MKVELQIHRASRNYVESSVHGLIVFSENVFVTFSSDIVNVACNTECGTYSKRFTYVT